MTAKLVLADLPEDVRNALARGERVCVYDNGNVAATVVPETANGAESSSGSIDYREAMKGVPPLDDDFEKDIRGVFAPTIDDPWER